MRAIFATLGLAVLLVGCDSEVRSSASAASAEPSMVVRSITDRYGRPDVDDSTAYDNPRPPIVTRWLSYEKQHVKFFLVPDGVGTAAPPPYTKWRLFGIIDSQTKQPLSASEVAERMR